ncbi:MAG: protein-L-isoaspartate O-methyltransferase [Spirochaetes bacterium GWD1_27_9]|nr:MAG: protein-L-isoaspartate O-methyltransferase [Spirochaetes bacterium GWB1_27_13]OHD20947.1 MAG: protein-L-isoaspartate O-methyltransferase [Spirochaetes bacterium GWC1_27_15]OHD33798.1 MAG: protein-L-isoaspartate O-methyltransferase [Spirochaetes bacterium GWD1_27_9]
MKQRSTSYLDSILRDQKVIDAMLRVDRSNFLPTTVKDYSYEDNPVPIGFGQTCSQPSMVAFVLDKLQIERGNVILEIGAGCGYAAAIASVLCGNEGLVYASEIIPQLAENARYNLAGFENIKIISDDGSCGFKEYSPFDRIFISAGVSSSNFNSNILLSQLKNNGILIYPEAYGNIYKLKKIEDKIIKEVFYGVSFVPLRGKNT